MRRIYENRSSSHEHKFRVPDVSCLFVSADMDDEAGRRRRSFSPEKKRSEGKENRRDSRFRKRYKRMKGKTLLHLDSQQKSHSSSSNHKMKTRPTLYSRLQPLK